MKLQGTKSVSSRHRFTCRFFKKQNLTRKAYFIDHEQGNDMLHQHSFAPFKAGGAGTHTEKVQGSEARAGVNRSALNPLFGFCCADPKTIK